MDDGSPIGYLIAIFAFILGGGYFAATEIALASVNRIRIMSYADDGNRRAKRVLYIFLILVTSSKAITGAPFFFIDKVSIEIFPGFCHRSRLQYTKKPYISVRSFRMEA